MCEFESRLQVWLEGAQKIIDKTYKQSFSKLWELELTPKLKLVAGKKYVKVVAVNPDQSIVFAFINMKTGDVLKPASWKRPAKHARGNIFNRDDGLDCVTPYGIKYLK